MMNGNSANFDRRLAKLESTKLGVPANLASFRIPKSIVREGNDVDQIIRDMEARGEIPLPGSLPAAQIGVIVHRIISPPNGEPNWERYHTERHRALTLRVERRCRNYQSRNDQQTLHDDPVASPIVQTTVNSDRVESA